MSGRSTHGATRGRIETLEYRIWKNMRGRCLNKNSKDYPYYGGRGITVCERWNDFKNFIDDMGKKPNGHSLDRIDNSKGYSPCNCRWATKLEQMNNIRTNQILTIDGVSKPLPVWAREYGHKRTTVQARLLRGWDHKRAVMTKVLDVHERDIFGKKGPKHFLTINGVKKGISEWSEIYKVKLTTIYSRLKRNWSDEDAVMTKTRKINYVRKKNGT